MADISGSNPYDFTKSLRLKIQIHDHTTNSDGTKTPAEVATLYQTAAYDALAITDHNVYTWPWYTNAQQLAIATSYKITAGTYAANAPKNWTFQGSHNGSTWTTLDTQTGIVFGNGETKTFTIANTTAYRYYLLNITLTGDGTSMPAVRELQILNGATVITPTMTDNVTPTPCTVSASSEYSSTYAAWKAFDGNVVSGGWQAANGQTTGWLKIDFGPYVATPVHGCEFTSGYTGHLWHIISLFNGAALVGTDPQVWINDIVAAGGIAEIAHPNYSGDTSAELLGLTGYTGIEIYNRKCELIDPYTHAYALDLWDELLTAGRHVWGYSVDDSHGGATEYDGGHIVVLCNLASEIQDALVAGNFYSVVGDSSLNFTNISLSGTTLSVTVNTAADITFIGTGGTTLQTSSAATTANYTITGTEGYIRVEAAAAGCTIYSNPLTVNGIPSISGTITVNGNTPADEGLTDSIDVYLYDLDNPVPNFFGLPAPVRGWNAIVQCDGATGAYSFTGLTIGHDYKILSLFASGGSLIPTWYNDVPNASAATPVTVSGDITGIDIDIPTGSVGVSGAVDLPAGATGFRILFLDPTLYCWVGSVAFPASPYPGSSDNQALSASGSYLVAMFATNDYGMIGAPLWYDNQADCAEATPVAGDATGIDIGFPATPPPVISSIDPVTVDNVGIISVTLTGTGFASFACSLKLAGQADIPASYVDLISSMEMTCRFDLTDVAPGRWDVVVTNIDGQEGTLASGFLVTQYVAPADFAITSIDTAIFYQNRMAYLTVVGTGFESGDVVELRKGSTVLPATEVTVISSTGITCMFQVGVAEIGLWDLTVTHLSPSESVSLVRCFEVKKDPREGIYLNDLSINDGIRYATMLTGWSPKVADLRMKMSDPSLANGQTFIPGTKKDENQDLPISTKVMGANKAELKRNLGLLLQEFRKDSILVSVYPADSAEPTYYYDAYPSAKILNDPYWQVEYKRGNIAVVDATLNARPGPRLDWHNNGEGLDLARGTGVNDSFERGLDGWVVTGTGTVTTTGDYHAPDGGGFSARLENGNGEVCILTDEVARPINPLHHHNFQVGVLEVGFDISVSVDAECFDADGTSLGTLALLLPWNPVGSPDWNDAMLVPFNYAGTDRYGKAILNPEDFPAGTVSLKLTITNGAGGAANACCIDAIWFGDTEYMVGHQYSGLTAFNIPPGVIPGDCAVSGDLYFSSSDIPNPWAPYDAGNFQLTHIAGSDDSHMFVCGLGGKMIFGDGTTWVPQATRTLENLYGVTAPDSTHAWACGHGKLLFSNGSTWATQTFPTLAELAIDGVMEEWTDIHHLTRWDFIPQNLATLAQGDPYQGSHSARIQFPANAQPLVPDSGFETLATQYTWQHWIESVVGSPDFFVMPSTAQKHSGSRSVQFHFGATNSSKSGYLITKDRVGINPNGTFTISVQTLVAPIGVQGGNVFAGSKFFQIKAYNAAGTLITTKQSGNLSAGTDWNWSGQTYGFVLPSNAASMTIALCASNPASHAAQPSDLWWDDVTITFTPVAANGVLMTKAPDLTAISNQQNYMTSFEVKGYGGRWFWAKVNFYNSGKVCLGNRTIRSAIQSPDTLTAYSHLLTPADYFPHTAYVGFEFYAEDTNSWASRYVEFDNVSLRLVLPNLKSIHAVSNTEIYAVGEWGTILLNNTGGDAWVGQDFPYRDNLNAVHASDAQHIIMVGDAGKLYTNTGTGVWSPRITNTTENLNDVVVVRTGGDSEPGYAYAVGDNGTVLYSEWDTDYPGVAFGSAWTTLPKLAGNLHSVCAVDTVSPAGIIIFIVGDNGRVYSNESGTFVSIGQAGRGTLRGIYMSAVDKGWVCGDNGSLFSGINDVSYLSLTNLIVGQAFGYDRDYSPVIAAMPTDHDYTRRLGAFANVSSGSSLEFVLNAKAHKGQHLPTIGAKITGSGSDSLLLQGQLKTVGGAVLTPLNAGQTAKLGITTTGKFHELALASGARTRWDPIDIPSDWTSPSANLGRINEILKVTFPTLAAGTAGGDCLTLIPVDRYCEVWNIATTPTIIFDSHGHNILYSADGTIEAAAVLPSTQTLQTPKIMADPQGMNFVIGAWNVNAGDEQLTPRPTIRMMFQSQFLAAPHD